MYLPRRALLILRDSVILLITPHIGSYHYTQLYSKGINILSGAAVVDCSVVQNLSQIFFFDC